MEVLVPAGAEAARLDARGLATPAQGQAHLGVAPPAPSLARQSPRAHHCTLTSLDPCILTQGFCLTCDAQVVHLRHASSCRKLVALGLPQWTDFTRLPPRFDGTLSTYSGGPAGGKEGGQGRAYYWI